VGYPVYPVVTVKKQTTGFLQVWKNWKKSDEFGWSRKVRGKQEIHRRSREKSGKRKSMTRLICKNITQ